MERRKFLSLIPSLSATPFMAKEIFQSKDKIEIIKPESAIIKPISQDLLSHWRDIDVHFVYKNQIVARGLLTSFAINREVIDVTTEEEFLQSGYHEYAAGVLSARFEGQLNGSF